MKKKKFQYDVDPSFTVLTISRKLSIKHTSAIMVYISPKHGVSIGCIVELFPNFTNRILELSFGYILRIISFYTLWFNVCKYICQLVNPASASVRILSRECMSGWLNKAYSRAHVLRTLLPSKDEWLACWYVCSECPSRLT